MTIDFDNVLSRVRARGPHDAHQDLVESRTPGLIDDVTVVDNVGVIRKTWESSGTKDGAHDLQGLRPT
jgi:hypothetical protein